MLLICEKGRRKSNVYPFFVFVFNFKSF
jgi:hypothetical protein